MDARNGKSVRRKMAYLDKLLLIFKKVKGFQCCMAMLLDPIKRVLKEELLSSLSFKHNGDFSTISPYF